MIEIGRKVFSGISWSLSSQLIRMALQLATIPILARLLSPQDFGLYAMAIPVVGLAGLLQEFGLQQAIMQKERVSHEQLNAIFWINFLISTAVAAGLVFISPLIARFYSDDRLELLVSAFGVLAFLGSFSFGQYAVLNRELRFKTIALIDVCCAIASFIAAVSFASVYQSFWALWAGGFASVMTWVILAFAIGTWRPGIPRLNVKLEGMFRFGSDIMVHNLANFLARNLDNILIGKYLGSGILGLYDRAYKILLYPLENLANPVSRVMVPLLSRVRGDQDQFRRVYFIVSGSVSLVCVPGLAAAIGSSHDVVRILLGEGWLGVAPIFFWLGFAGLVQPVIISTNWVLISEGRTKELMRISLLSSVAVAFGFVVGLRWGVVGVAASFAIVECLFRLPLTVWLAGRSGSISWRQMLETFLPILAGSLLAIYAIDYVALHVSGWRLISASLAISYLFAGCVLTLFPAGRLLILALWRQRKLIH